MRAALLTKAGASRDLAIADIQRPHPRPDQVLVMVGACGVCGHDLADQAGLLASPLPAVLGHEIAGTVVGVGTAATRFRVGDRVAAKQFATCGRCVQCTAGDELHCARRSFTYGGFAEYVALRETALLAVPPTVPLIQAAVVACAVGTGLQALRRAARLRAGETVLITGAGGGLGLHAIQVARALGARVIALTGHTSKAARLAKLGADQVVALGDAAYEEVLDLTMGHGVDLVLDNTGHPRVFRQAFRALAIRGRYVLTGQVSGEPIRIHPAFVLEKEAIVTGSASTSMSTFTDAMSMVADGEVAPLVATYPLGDVAQALTDLDAGRVVGRAVVVPGRPGTRHEGEL